jgi:hypothetical protein
MLLPLTACNKLDVIGDRSVTSFQDVLQASKDQVSPEETYDGWSLTAPDQTARFIWSKEFNQKDKMDVLIETDAKPLIDAGMDTDKLPEGMLQGDKIVVGANLGSDKASDQGKAEPLESYRQFVKLYRDHLKYHAKLDHFGIDLSGGNVFEWAKDMKTNDKDIVFVLNPQVFLKAGTDPNKVKGWLFAAVETMDDNGRKIKVDKFLKPFDLVK